MHICLWLQGSLQAGPHFIVSSLFLRTIFDSVFCPQYVWPPCLLVFTISKEYLVFAFRLCVPLYLNWIPCGERKGGACFQIHSSIQYILVAELIHCRRKQSSAGKSSSHFANCLLSVLQCSSPSSPLLLPCPSTFLSVAAKKHPDQKQLKGKRGLICLMLPDHSPSLRAARVKLKWKL